MLSAVVTQPTQPIGKSGFGNWLIKLLLLYQSAISQHSTKCTEHKTHGSSTQFSVAMCTAANIVRNHN